MIGEGPALLEEDIVIAWSQIEYIMQKRSEIFMKRF
jgi:hypothetical protein